jgi:hypothetical protein
LANVGRYVDPLGSALSTGEKGRLDPLNLRKIGKVDIPPPPPPPQELKEPDSMNARRKSRSPYNATLLSGGASGVAAGSLNTGGSTLLGG